MEMKASHIVFTICFVVCCFVGSVFAEDFNSLLPFKDVELPKDITLVQPGTGVPATLANFVGVWTGVWNSGIENVLVVTSINDKEAKVIYAWGPAPQFGLNQKGILEYTATVEATNKITFTNIYKSKWTYKISEDGKELKGTYEGSDGISSKIKVKKLK
jgi:hypothetical protein